MHRAYASFDKTKKGSMQQRELADLRSTFLVSEETPKAFGDDLGNLRWHHLVRSNVTRKSGRDGMARHRPCKARGHALVEQNVHTARASRLSFASSKKDITCSRATLGKS